MKTFKEVGRNGSEIHVLRDGSLEIKIYPATQAKGGKLYAVYTVVHYEAGKRVKKSFADLGVAKTHAQTTIIRLMNGVTSASDMRPVDIQEAAQARLELNGLDVGLLSAVQDYRRAVTALNGKASLMDAVQFYLDSGMIVIESVKVADVADELVKAKKADKLSSRYSRDLRLRCAKFAKAFPGAIAQIRTAEIEAWLRNLGLNPRNRNNYARTITTLFNFAKRAGYLPRDRATAAGDLSKAKDIGGDIQIYTPRELREALNRLVLFKPEMVPFVAIGAFAGIRTAELGRLRWEDIDFEGNLIEVSAGKSKTSQRRHIPIQPNLAAWLLPFKDCKGAICPSKKTQLIIRRFLAKKIRHSDGKVLDGIAWKPNGLRHSYGSYRLPILKSAAELALEMGNSPAVIFRHYRELVKPAAADDYWAILPPS
ncbi:MAG: site-specific integrase [Verrucomicrobiota bacterium]